MAQRLLAALALAALIVGAGAARSIAGEAGSAARGGSESLDSYCAPTGDFCTEIVERHGRLKFEIHAVAEYFDSYKVCVKGPSGDRECAQSKLRRRGELWEGRVDYLKNFTGEGPGTYTVIWRIPGSRLGEPLSFSAGSE